MRYIYISPHLDDAVLSAGGLIYDQSRVGIPVEIWTFMCGFPEESSLTDFAKMMHQAWGTGSARETVKLRREEDQTAAATVGAKSIYFDFFDCIYRRGADGEALYTDIYVPPHEADAELVDQIAQMMAAALEPDDVVVCQLSVGSHVDHAIVRQAAEKLGRPLVYDADIPYLLTFPGQLPLKTVGMKEPTVQIVSEAGLDAWIEGISAYASQLDVLFGGQDEMRKKMNAYWSQEKGIRFWKFD